MGITYYSNRGELNTIPNYVTARTPQGLRRAMLRVNMRLKAFASFYDIQFVNGRWYAWYWEDVDPARQPESEVTDGT